MKSHHRSVLGFQLLEILITLGILAIIASFSLAHYSAYLTKAKRLEAVAALMAAATALEKYQLINNTYENAGLEQLYIPTLVAEQHYRLSLETTANSYLLHATPLAGQATDDASCGVLTLSADGERSVSGAGAVGECW